MLIGRMNEDIGHLRDAKRMFIFVYFGGNLMMFFIHFIWKNDQKNVSMPKFVPFGAQLLISNYLNYCFWWQFVIQIFDASDVIIYT